MGMVGRLIAAALCIVACGGTASLSHAQAQGPRPLRVEGSTTVYSWIREWVPEFHSQTPGSLAVIPTSTGRGIASLCAKEIEVAMVSRDLDAEDQQTVQRAGIKLVTTLLGRDSVAFVVNLDNPVSVLSIEDLRNIFSGQCANWKEVGGEDAPILAIVPSPDRGTAAVVSGELLKTAFSPTARVVARYSTLVNVVSRNESAISFCRSELALSGRVKSLAIRKSTTSAAVEFSPGTMRDGSYPFTRPLFLCYDGNEGPRSELIRKFVDFCVHKAREPRH